MSGYLQKLIQLMVFILGSLLFVNLAYTASLYPVQNNQSVKSFREWKLTLIQGSEARVKILRENLNKNRSHASAKNTTEAGLVLDKELNQLSIAKDLTISDYFVGYLTKQKSLSVAIKEVSGRLSAEEVAELMTAYANNFFSSKPKSTQRIPRADLGN